MQIRSEEDEFLYLIASKLCRAADREAAVNEFCKALKVIGDKVGDELHNNLLPLG